MSPPLLRRLGITVFLFHLAATLVLGYLVIPRFDSAVEPPPPPAHASILVAVSKVFYFPVVSWAAGSLITGFSRPNLWLVLCNSALVALAFMSTVLLVTGRKHAVA